MKELVLTSESLLSKCGFNDGDEPEDLLVLLDDVGVLGGYDYYLPDKVWHNVLCRLVREWLLPRLDQHVEVEVLDTNHNPIRARTVNGRDVSRLWHRTQEPRPDLTPESVRVPIDVVMAAIDAEMPNAVTCEKSTSSTSGREGS